MNKTVAEARDLVFKMAVELREIGGVEKVLCPPFPSLVAVSALLAGTDIGLGAQNMHWEAKGAFTGEVAPNMVKEFCNYVIIGHSERRAYFGETDESVNRKVRAAQAADLTPIVCVGETLEQYESNRTSEVVARQIRDGLAGTDPALASRLVVAYEPVWAIGTGRTARGADAAAMADAIRATAADLGAPARADALPVLYGGSVTSASAAEFLAEPAIDGALVGGASLKVDEMAGIVARAAVTAQARASSASGA